MALDQRGTNWISSFWVTEQDSLTWFKQMYTRMGLQFARWGTCCGSTQLLITILTPFSGTITALCKFLDPNIFFPKKKTWTQFHLFYIFLKIFRGRSPDQGLHELRQVEQFLPRRETNVLICKHMECWRLGNKRWTWENRLEKCTICVFIQGLQRRCLSVGRALSCLRINHGGQLVGSVPSLTFDRVSENWLCLGFEEFCYLWLLSG